MKSICFVANEIYPMQKGGIARFIYNIFNRYNTTTDIKFLLFGAHFNELNLEYKSDIYELYGKESVIFLKEIIHKSKCVDVKEDERVKIDDPIRWGYKQSYDIYRSIKYLIESGEHNFDAVEFLDIFAPSFCTSQARRLDPTFKDTIVSVRLHSTRSIISAHEIDECALTNWHAAVYDMERKALRDADVVVAHLESVLNANRRYYHFDETWPQCKAIELPPVVFDKSVETVLPPSRRGKSSTTGQEPVFVFSSRIEAFKQPSLFIQGAISYLRNGGAGKFYLACYGFDQAYIDQTLAEIPYDLRNKIVHEGNLNEEERLKLLENSIICIPSTYESYCFFAYESLARGNTVILNATCPAFEDGTFWVHAENCLKFDGSIAGLRDAFESAAKGWCPTSFDLPQEAEEPYWMRVDELTHTPASPATETGKMGILKVLNFDADEHRITVSKLLNGEIAVENEVSVERVDQTLMDHKYIYDVAALARVLEGVDYVAFCPDGMLLSPAFCEQAVRALDRKPEMFAVLSNCTPFSRNGLLSYVRGDAPSSVIRDIDRIGFSGAVYRTEILGYLSAEGNESRWWRQKLLARLVFDGKRLMVDPNPDHAACITDECLHNLLTPVSVQAGLRQVFEPLYWQKFPLPVYSTDFHVNGAPGELEHVRRELQFASAMCEERLATIHKMSEMIAERDKQIERLQMKSFLSGFLKR